MSSITLKQLTLKNFKGIKEFKMDFSELTNIYGENATGKTTIFDAFTWLLFDKDSSDRKDFDIKTLDSNNEVIHGLEHQVTGTLNIDGKDISLSKIYKEKWNKKKGEAEKTFTGHETLYYINEVPVKKKEYQEAINNIIDERLFKLISNPLYFSNMKWQDRRNVLLDIIGDITADKIINYRSNLKKIEQLLNDNDVDNLKKSIAARKRKLNDEIKSIPYRIDELNNSIQEHDFDGLEFRKRGIVSGINKVEEELLDSSKINNELLKEKDRIYSLKSKLKDIEYREKNEAQAPLEKLREELSEIKFELNSKENELTYKEKEIKKLQEDIQKEEHLKEDLKKQWYAENEKQLKFDENEFICPTCKRPLEEHDVEQKKNEMLENFNQNKAQKIREINQLGKERNAGIEKLQNKLSSIDLDSLRIKIDNLKNQRNSLDEKVNNFKPSLNLESNEEYQEKLKEIQQLEAKIHQPKEVNQDIETLKISKKELEAQLEEVNRKLADKDNNEKIKFRINELSEKEKELARQIAALEGQEFLCEEFIKTKVELLERSINNKFQYVSFKLFDTQINGGLVETCEALINGVPFSNANNASQINAGLDIINALSEHYEITAPIFIDNRESINEILQCNSQMVNLIVSNDKKLKIEKVESEVA
jgi:DNA repair protein SbcC/Rad50